MQPDWQTPVGRLLLTFAEAIQKKQLCLDRPILVFGSAPLQIFFDPAFLSADVDIASAGNKDVLQKSGLVRAPHRNDSPGRARVVTVDFPPIRAPSAHETSHSGSTWGN